ncbi:hypothetical protein BBH99_06750 [Chryseobacterium contaminans]|uniref:DUF4374 domain-containing protein n=1 Tax=Chryseobacterium contaminans TaxID=1423959 RepID=A0A1M6ZWK1_9FLAO|nr:hypothetical protein [Chryseobacterium contaminans]OCA79070.1 hypothetical protein BBH99_06750 [Chryseobacterium contaminans]SHL34898.1 hypothetical protein SAMN05444407_103397 [Chryseobacterium contaminans]
MKIQILAFLTTFLLCISCNNEDIPLIKKNSYDVYIGGVDNNKACYWKNGQQIFVQGGENLVGTQIIVDNNDVYLFGTNIKELNPKPAWYFWKNGVKHKVSEYLNTASDNDFSLYSTMTVHNGDIYFLGMATNPSSTSVMDRYHYCYWKNGVKTVLETLSAKMEIILNSGTHIFNNEVYSAVLKDTTLSPIPHWELGYYKNTAFNLLTNPNHHIPHDLIKDPSNPSQLYLITKTNTYPLQHISSIRNITSGNDIQIPANILQSKINQVCFEGSDKYYIGKDFYYKNNTLVPMNTTGGFNNIGQFTVKDNNVYSTRTNATATSVKFYINDVETQSLPDMTKSGFNSIFVVKK